MKIKAVRLAEVGLFRDAVAVEGLSGGLDVLVGPNELGKSTLFRAIETVFLKRHTMTGQQVEALEPRGGGSPLIEADFEAQGQSWRITKRFGRGRSAELIDLDKARIAARGADAEEQLASLIGHGGVPGRFGLLWVGQQQSLVVPRPDVDPASGKAKDRGEEASLRAAVGREIDTVAGSDLLRRIAAEVMSERGTYLQLKRGQPKAGLRYDTVLKLRREAADKLAALRAEFAQAEDRLQRYARLVAERDQAASSEVLARLATAAEAAEADAALAEKASADLARLKEAEKAARLERDQISGRLDDFTAKLEEDRVLDAERRSLDEASAVAERERAAAAALLFGIDDRIGELERAQKSLTAAFERRRARAAAGEQLLAFETRRRQARAAAEDIERLTQIIEADPATPERLRRLADAAHLAELAASRAALPAAVTLAVALEPGGVGQVQIDGEVAPDRAEYEVGAELSIAVAGIGTFRIVPRDAVERRQLKAKAIAAAEALRAVEDELGGVTLPAAEALAGQRAAHERELASARISLAAAAPDGMATLEAAIATLGARVSDEAGEDQVRPADHDWEAERQRIEGDTAAARRARDAGFAAVKEREHEVQRIRQRGAEIGARRSVLAAAMGPEGGRSGERDRLAGEADRARAAAAARLDELRRVEATAPAPERARILSEARESARDALRQAEQNARRLAKEIAELEGEIRAAGEAEISPAIARLEGELAAYDREIAHHEHQIAALALLSTTIDEVAAANRTRFLDPVMRRMSPYLDLVFPDTEVSLDEKFVLAKLKRGGSGEEPIGELSDGTREQLAILVRLAFARLLAETGSPAPLILDDALVYSDDERIVRMFASLEAAAPLHQVIVFTCRSKTFATLGGKRLSLVPW